MIEATGGPPVRMSTAICIEIRFWGSYLSVCVCVCEKRVVLCRFVISNIQTDLSITYISRRHWDFVSIIDVQSMVCPHDRVHLSAIIMQTYLNFWNACQVYAVECVSQIKSFLPVTFNSIYGVYPIPLWWSWECVLYLIIITKLEV